jgi:hypothetical protein
MGLEADTEKISLALTLGEDPAARVHRVDVVSKQA